MRPLGPPKMSRTIFFYTEKRLLYLPKKPIPDPAVGEVESAAFREAFRSLDTVHIGRIYSRRAAVMRSLPQFLWEEVVLLAAPSVVVQTTSWWQFAEEKSGGATSQELLRQN